MCSLALLFKLVNKILKIVAKFQLNELTIDICNELKSLELGLGLDICLPGYDLDLEHLSLGLGLVMCGLDYDAAVESLWRI